MNAKYVFASKTVLFNIIMMIIAMVPLVATMMKAITPDQAVMIDAIAAFVMGVGNLIIRIWFTDQPITFHKR